MARLLVTGGQGMVGQNLRAHPAIAGWEVLAPGRAELDLLDGGAVRDWIARHRPDAVIHAAGRVGGIQANIAEPVRFLAENAQMGLNLLGACLEAGVERVINLSSSCVYPRDLGEGLSEERILTGPLEPTNEGYALAKIMAMRFVSYALRERPALGWRTLVPCNLYGPHDSFDPARSHLVPAILRKLDDARRTGATEVEIWGDGEARREFMYAPDLAEAVLRALDDPRALPEVMNVGPGEDHSINEYYRLAAEIVGWRGRFVHDLSRPVGMRRKLLDVGRQRAWGWAPRTPLREGLAATWAWYLENRT